jgi:two-component system, OmpR family, sensor histidine kinase SenX3
VRIIRRQRAIYFVITLGVCLVVAAIALNVGWVILNWRQEIKLFLGAILFLAIIAGVLLNTIFLVREIRRNEQHDSFINAITHELKTPIASIRLYLQTLQSRAVDENQRREFYQSMLLDSERLMHTVEQVLKAGESAQRKRPPQLLPLEFNRLVRECLDLARSRHHLQINALDYRETLNVGSAEVAGDPEELRTAVSNLIDNAIKYSPNGVRISVELDVPDPRRVVLRVRDHGVGIPAHELKRIFKRFYRVAHRSLSGVKGTGLGLFIVRSIARKHGGKVFAQSDGLGKGTTVTLELPRRLA